MKRYKIRTVALAIALLWIVQMVGVSAASAAEKLADGTYTIDYVIRQAENDNVSMANDYFEKPAKLTVKGGVVTAQIQLNHSKWITEFTTALGGSYPAAKIVKNDEAKDTRIAQFTIEDLSKPLLSKIHVTVPDIDYDHDYTIRFVFDQSTAKSTGAAASSKPAATTKDNAASGSSSSGAGAKATETKATGTKQTTGTTQQQSTAEAKPAAQASEGGEAATAEPNPKTGDEAPIGQLVTVLLVSAGCFVGFTIAKRSGRQKNEHV
ncbi:heme uptake protein IsdC [Paenibacillus phyllosphaerae]|uniref:Heme uptake protein IsdC n=1 Tax=Paenibacillus phyllosphaerae TaxID=274593 RepID=A0A7W5FPX5_9BACL|nr:heme uptake protein IsdC [Paenibacillus phyllosphaerae]MBB3112454.1 heme uptake protein IsdC [Paenibacillus phyllosphaerae]